MSSSSVTFCCCGLRCVSKTTRSLVLALISCPRSSTAQSRRDEFFVNQYNSLCVPQLSARCRLFFTTPRALPAQQTMILKRLLRRCASCRSVADDANMFLCAKIDRTQHVTKTAQRHSPAHRVNVLDPEESEIQMFSNLPVHITRSLYGPRHLNLEVKSVLVCRVKLSLAATNGMVSTSCLFPLRRNAMSCFTTSCPVKPHHGHYSQGAASVLMTRGVVALRN